MNPSHPRSTPTLTLTSLARGEVVRVAGLALDVSTGLTQEERELLITRLRDLGFVAGARCELLARMWLGGDPLVVRIGGSTFALRRAEAAAVYVQRLETHATAA
ncbi:MAG: ferrous iron transport protein A [Steroidobacteraceae bacterium]|nr:ferrous iron transport protein A [Steroidobacteraceae bacterium]